MIPDLTSMVHLLMCVTAAIAAVLLFRILLRQMFGAQLSYACWMIVPFTILATLLPLPDWLSGAAIVQWSVPVVASTGSVPGVAGIEIADLLIGWAAGAALLGLMQILRQRAFVRGLGAMRRNSTGEWITAQSSVAPAVVGVFAPRIVLPEDFHRRYNAEERVLVLAHERMHVARRDPLVILLAEILRAGLWFHPLAHVAAHYLRVDQELACDARVMQLHPQHRSSYASALLKTHLVGSLALVACRWDSRSAVFLERRFVMLKNTLPSRARRCAGMLSIVSLVSSVAGVAWSAQPQSSHSAPVTRSLQEILPGGLSEKTMILIDGRRASLDEANKIPTSAIERIELLPAGGVNFVRRVD